jgi:phosphate starvation-inducible PhoH-like protein
MRKQNRDKKIDKKFKRAEEGTHKISEDRNKKIQFRPVQAKNEFQKRVFRALSSKKVIVVSGPAGVGKSFLTMSKALEDYTRGLTHKIYLARPAVGMSNSLGMLKGDLRQKYEPFLMPLVSVITESLGRGFYECALNNGNVEMVPFEYLRGRNLDGWTIVDEIQNCSASELYSVLTRITDTGKLVLLGDKTQHDLNGEDGVTWLKEFVYNNNLQEHVEFIEGDSDDIVRSDFVKAIVKAKEREMNL